MANKTFQEMMSDARLALITGREFLRINSGSDMSRMTVDALCVSLQDLLGAQLPEMPEMQQLEPIDFGQTDEDRVKDVFEKVFLVEYELSRNGLGIDSAMDMASSSANSAAKLYRRWLKAQEPK